MFIARFFFSFFIVGWFIYGNINYYKYNLGDICTEDNDYGSTFCMSIILIYGYYEMLKCCCFGTVACILTPFLII